MPGRANLLERLSRNPLEGTGTGDPAAQNAMTRGGSQAVPTRGQGGSYANPQYVPPSSGMKAYFETHQPGEWSHDPQAMAQFAQIYGPQAAAMLQHYGAWSGAQDPNFHPTAEQLQRIGPNGEFYNTTGEFLGVDPTQWTGMNLMPGQMDPNTLDAAARAQYLREYLAGGHQLTTAPKDYGLGTGTTEPFKPAAAGNGNGTYLDPRRDKEHRGFGTNAGPAGNAAMGEEPPAFNAARPMNRLAGALRGFDRDYEGRSGGIGEGQGSFYDNERSGRSSGTIGQRPLANPAPPPEPNIPANNWEGGPDTRLQQLIDQLSSMPFDQGYVDLMGGKLREQLNSTNAAQMQDLSNRLAASGVFGGAAQSRLGSLDAANNLAMSQGMGDIYENAMNNAYTDRRSALGALTSLSQMGSNERIAQWANALQQELGLGRLDLDRLLGITGLDLQIEQLAQNGQLTTQNLQTQIALAILDAISRADENQMTALLQLYQLLMGGE